jgi:hypothetical protein
MILVRGEMIKTMTPDEVKKFIEWATAARVRTTFDPGIIGYPRTAVLITEDEKGPLSFLACQTTIMAEVFIPRPDATDREKAASLGKFDKSIMKIAAGMNVGDVYCFIPDSEEDYAEKVQNHGWKEVPAVRLFKKSTGVSVGGTH